MIIGFTPVVSHGLSTPSATKAAASQTAAIETQDGVHLTGASPSATPAARQSGVGRFARTMFVGLALSASMMGLTGCSTMMMDTKMAPNLQQMVTGSEAKSGFNSFQYLDSVSSQAGGGI